MPGRGWRQRVLIIVALVAGLVWLRQCAVPVTWGAFEDDSRPVRKWSALHTLYPDGTSEGWLVWSLRLQGFTVDPLNHSASKTTHVLPFCEFYNEIRWTEAGKGRVKAVKGTASDACV